MPHVPMAAPTAAELADTQHSSATVLQARTNTKAALLLACQLAVVCSKHAAQRSVVGGL